MAVKVGCRRCRSLPVTLGASYADHKMRKHKTRIVNAYVSGDVTATMYLLQYNRNQEKLRLTSKPLKMLESGLWHAFEQTHQRFMLKLHANVDW